MASDAETESISHALITSPTHSKLELKVPTAAVSIDPNPISSSAFEHATSLVSAAKLLAHGLPASSVSEPVSQQKSTSTPKTLETGNTDMKISHSEEARSPAIEVKEVVDDLCEEVDFKMPQWFLDKRVLTAEELREKDTNLRVYHGREGDDDKSSVKADMYEIDSGVYEALREVAPASSERNENGKNWFKYDAVYLRYPVKVDSSQDTYRRAFRSIYDPGLFDAPTTDPVPSGTEAFLAVLVEQFARDSGADLVTLTGTDLRDLVAEFANAQGAIYEGDALHFGLVKAYCNRAPPTPHVESGRSWPAPNDEVVTGPTFPWDSIMSAPSQKSSLPDTGPAERKPMILHVPKVQDVVQDFGVQMLDILNIEVQRMRGQGYSATVLLTSHEHYAAWYPEKAVLSATGEEPMKNPIYVTPRKSADQISLFMKHQREEKHDWLASNIRDLQYLIRTKTNQAPVPALLIPYTRWDFLGKAEAFTNFSKSSMKIKDLEVLADRIGASCEPEKVLSELRLQNQRRESFKYWWPAVQEQYVDKYGKSGSGKWVNYPEHVQDAVREIEASPDSFVLERGMLNLLVDPKDIEQGWGDIAVDHKIKDTILQLIEQSFASTEKAYGILKRSRINGALLYGPPGTGKTQLARIVARACGAAMLCVSAADIEHKYLGETEQAIQALFKLARMLYPSIIFIDEADALFQSRELDTQEYSRSRKNQLLAEMDGLLAHKHPPFTLLATNYPSQLDHAVLRRVPSLLYLGLPSVPARKRIFDIYLQDESLDTDVDMDSLASKTLGYSGSDIKTLCVQTALICDTFTGQKRRLLKKKHFHAALKRCAPTVSWPALQEINSFATMHDPGALGSLVDSEFVNQDDDGILEASLSDVNSN